MDAAADDWGIDDLFLSDADYQTLGEQFCAHYIGEGRTEDEAVALVLEHLQDPKWKLDIAHKVKSTEEITNAAVATLEEHDPERTDEVVALVAEYTDQAHEFHAHLLSLYPDMDVSGVGDAVRGIDTRAELIAGCKADGTQLESFLRRFFARFLPWDGSGREDKAQELYRQFFFRASWDALYTLLKDHYPRVLELNELQVLKSRGREAVGVDGTNYASTLLSDGSHPGAFAAAQVEGAAPATAVAEAPPRAPRGPRLRLTRQQWLQHNAFVARYFILHKRGNAFKQFVREVLMSVGYRVYIALFYLFPGAWHAGVYSVHLLTAVAWRLFLPEDPGYLPTLGLFCIFVAAAFAVASLWTQMLKTLQQWVYLDDAVFFGDVDFAKRWTELNLHAAFKDANVQEMVCYDDRPGPHPPLNPIPREHAATLPPLQTATFFGLLTSESVHREYYCIALELATIVVPLLYCVIRTAVDGASVYYVFAHFAEWCVVGGVAIHLFLWVGAWGFTLRAKYRAYHEWSEERSALPFESDERLLPELALDKPTGARNVAFFVCLSLPVGILFWTTCRASLKYPYKWILTLVGGIAYLLVVREMAAKPRTFTACLVFSAAAFFILGVVGTITLDVGAFALFFALMSVTQCLLIPHRYRPPPKINKQDFLDQADEELTEALRVQQAAGAEDGGGRDGRRTSTAADARSGEAGASASGDGTVNGTLHGATVQVTVERILERQTRKAAPRGVDRSLVPCERVLRSICIPIVGCICPTWLVGDNDAASRDAASPTAVLTKGGARPAGFWRLPSLFYGDAPNAKSRQPRRKTMLQVAPRAMAGFAFLFFMSCVFVLAVAGFLRQATADGEYRPVAVAPGTGGAAGTGAAPPSNVTYPICNLRWSGMSVVDVAVLAEVGYLVDNCVYRAGYAPQLNASSWVLNATSRWVRPGENRTCEEEGNPFDAWGENAASEVDWLHFTSEGGAVRDGPVGNATHHVVVLRSNLEGRNLKRDVDVWGDSLAYQVIAAVVPLLRLLPTAMAAEWVDGLAAFKSSLDGGLHPTHYLERLRVYVQEIAAASPGPVTLVGHASNGGLAAVAGAKLGLPVVAFSPPGTGYLAVKMGLNFNPRQLAVQAASDIMADMDEQGASGDYFSPHTPSALIDISRENDALKKKIKFLQHVGGVFRQKIGALFADAAQRGDPNMQRLNTVYRTLVDEMPSLDDVSPMRHHAQTPSGGAAPETSEGKYWHDKFMTATHKMKSMLSSQTETENRLAEDIRMLQETLDRTTQQKQELQRRVDAARHTSPQRGAGAPVPAESPLAAMSPGLLEARAHGEADTATQMLIASMKEDNHNLSFQLNDALERLRSVDALQQDCALLQKQNSLLRTRVHKIKDTNAQIKLESSSTVIEMQNNISTLLTSLNEANEVIAGKDTQIALLEETKESLIKDMQAMHHVVTTYKNKVTEFEAQTFERSQEEAKALEEHEKEKSKLHEEVKDGQAKVGELTDKLDDLSNQVQQQLTTLRDNSYHIELLNMEKMNLNERIEQMDMLLQERSQFGSILGEVETRLRDAVQELHVVQSTQHVADRVRELSDSVCALEGLESQLKIKDDLLAAKEDEILKLKEAMRLLEQSVNQISSMFLQMPKTVGEMERVIVERDVYRNAIKESGADPVSLSLDELDEAVHIQLIERNVMGKHAAAKAAAERSKRGAPGGMAAAADLLKLQPIPSPTADEEDAVMALAAQTLQALGRPGEDGADSDDDLLRDPPRSASTLGAMYESIYGKKVDPAVSVGASLTDIVKAAPTATLTPRDEHRGVSVTPQLEDSLPDTAPAASGRGHVDPMHTAAAADATPSTDLLPNDIIHAFRAFESNGRMDADHFKTCVLALGLNYTPQAEDVIKPHPALDLETFQRAILLCTTN